MFSYKNFKKKYDFTPVALVFGADWVNGLALIRGLGEQGVIVYALSSNPKAIGFHSKYVKNCIVHPNPSINLDSFLNFMSELGIKLKKRGEKGVLFPTGDLMVKIFSEREEELNNYFIFTFPTEKITANLLNKKIQYKKAIQNHIPLPKTYFENDLNLLNNDLKAKKTDFPLLLKACYSYSSIAREKYRALLITDEYQLVQIISQAKKDYVPFMIQEVIPGKDDTLYTFGSYMSKNGILKAIFTGRKLRQKPPGFGICRVGESIYVPKIIDYGYSLLKSLNFFGISQVEFKYDYRDHDFKLIEVNPRSWSWIGLPIKMGINIPYIAFCDVLGIDTKPKYMSRKKYLWMCIEDDIRYSLRLRDGIPLKHLFLKKKGFYEAYFSLKDLLPGLFHLRELFNFYFI